MAPEENFFKEITAAYVEDREPPGTAIRQRNDQHVFSPPAYQPVEKRQLVLANPGFHVCSGGEPAFFVTMHHQSAPGWR